MLINESVNVYELPTGFTLEATVSSSDSEISQWLYLQVSAFQPLSIIVSSAQSWILQTCRQRVLALLTSMCDNLDHVISCLQAVLCVDLRAEIICPDLNQSLF